MNLNDSWVACSTIPLPFHTIYDHVGRIKEGKTGEEARGGTLHPSYWQTQLPYRQSYTFNEFDDLTTINNLHWGKSDFGGVNFNKTYSYTNSRRTGNTYDSDGRLTKSTETNDEDIDSSFDVAGRLVKTYKTYAYDVDRHLDGNGGEVKRNKSIYIIEEEEPPLGGGGGGCEPFCYLQTDAEDLVKPGGPSARSIEPKPKTASEYWEAEDAIYYIRSSVLGGQVLSEANSTGKKLKTFVMAGGTTIAWQVMDYTFNPPYQERIYFTNTDASGMSRRRSDIAGYTMQYAEEETDGIELDALGNNASVFSPYFVWYTGPLPDEGNSGVMNLDQGSGPMVNGQRATAEIDGIKVPWNLAMDALANGSAVECPNNYCGPAIATNGSTGQRTLTSGYQYRNGEGGGYKIPLRSSVDVYNDDGTVDRGEFGIVGWKFHEVSSSSSSWNPRWQYVPRESGGEQSDCEKILAGAFTGKDSGAVFVDVNDGDGYDPIVQSDRTWEGYDAVPPFSGLRSETHNHIYNDPNGDINKRLNIYAPGGGKILDAGVDSENNNYITVFYKRFGSESNVVLQIMHVENFNKNLIGEMTGRGLLLGQMGENGRYGYAVNDNASGLHVHINAMKAWWKGEYKRKGKNQTPKFQEKLKRDHIRLSSYCENE